MTRWEYLWVLNGRITASARLIPQVYQYIQHCFPQLKGKDLVYDQNNIDWKFVMLPDVLDALGADGWEMVSVVNVGAWSYFLKRPTS